jgi:heat shock protein 90kDa beta
MTWESVLPQLRTDPRFSRSPLPLNQQQYLFHTHIAQLRSKHFESLHSLFQAHAPSLATSFSSLPLPVLLSSPPATRLGLGIPQLQHHFEVWQRERTHQARRAFNEMLSENSFVEFWGRLGKIGGEGVDGGVKADDLGEDEGEGGGGKVDMKALAKTVDVQVGNGSAFQATHFDQVPQDMEKVLQVSPPDRCHCRYSSLILVRLTRDT